MRYRPSVVVEEEVHDIAHDKRCYHDGKVYDSTDEGSPTEFLVEENGKEHAKGILDDGASNAVHQCVRKRPMDVLVLEKIHIVFETYYLERSGIAVPVRERKVHPFEEGIDYEKCKQHKCRHIEKVYGIYSFFHFLRKAASKRVAITT